MSGESFHHRRRVIAFRAFFLPFLGVAMPRWATFTGLVSADAIIIFLVCLGPTDPDPKTRGPFCMTVLSFITHKMESLVVGVRS